MSNLKKIDLIDRHTPLVLPWPKLGDPGGFIRFGKASEWCQFVESLGIDPNIPDIVQVKYSRAQTLFLLGWVDVGCIKASELAALIALELALMDRYGGHIAKRNRRFATLLRHMVETDGLVDASLPMINRCGGSALGQLTGASSPTLAELRNALAHGDPFEGAPTGGLLELVRDLINFAYRDYIAEAVRLSRAR